MSNIVALDCVPLRQCSNMEESQEWSLPATSYNEDADIKGSDLGHNVLSEFDGADRKVLSCPARKGSLLENSANVHLEARPVKFVDNSDNQKDPASGRTFADITKHDVLYPRNAAVPSMHQIDFLSKPRVEIETSLIDHVCNDNAERLVCWLRSMVQVLKVDGEGNYQKREEFETILGFWFPHRLLQLACQLDSVACAEALLEGETGLLSPVNAVDGVGKTALHFAASQLATRCISLLLKKRAKADMPSQDGCTPLRAALQSKRWPKDLQTLPANDIITILSNQDLTALKLLIDHTKDLLRLACHLAFDGDAAGLAALLLAAGKSFLGNVHKYQPFLDLVVERILACQRGNTNSGGFSEKDPTKFCNTDESKDEGYKSSLLKSLEIIVRLKTESVSSLSHSPYRRQEKWQSALLKAAQAGDEEVIKILLSDTSNVNEVDSDGNTALHWCLKTTKGLRIVWQLVTHGSLVSARNRLGLTPVHIAAGQGHLQALQLLLAQDPSAVHIATVAKETPLFSAVKNNHAECVKLLLQFGSNLQVLNLRRQRPVDFASSQEMRMILSESGRRATGKAQVNSDSKSCNSNKDRHQPQARCVIPNLDDGADFNEVQVNKFIDTQDDLDNSESWILRTQHAKTALCRYHMMPGGCARGDGCFYAHGEQELRPEAREKTGKVNNVFDRKKIFVGGLLPAMGSDDLKNCFEAEFGPVQEAIVMNSQTGGHIQSRGFGFVTFKNEASYTAAVKQHYLTICSKRVEIKAAFQSSKRTEEEMLRIHLPNTPALASDSQEALKRLSWSNMTTGEISMSFENEASTNLIKSETAAICHAESVSLKRCNPPWLAVFKTWLPEFLSSVYRRQRGVEYYPLSSVKADFRATCGMELDHMALGFPKLSDFLRTMPELCRMKIVPVGRGPATHVVLHMRQQSLVPKSHQATLAKSKISTSSLVHEGRTYAAAASYNIASSSEIKKEVQNTDCEDLLLLRSQSNIVGDSSDLDDSSCAHHFSGPASSFKDSTANNKDNKQPGIVDSNKLSLFSTFNTEEPHQQKLPKLDAFRAWQQGLAGNRLAAPEDDSNNMWTSITNSQFRSVTSEPCATQPPPQQHVPTFSEMYHTPYMERTIPVSSETAFSTLCRDIAPFYNPWNSNTFEECRNLIQRMNLAATGEESPQSSLTSEDPLDSPQTLSEVSSQLCVLCGDKAAVWVAIPCTHKAICSPCKTQLHTSNRGLRQCFICQGRAREWIAQYH